MVSSGFVQNAGAEIYYERIGSGPAIVLFDLRSHKIKGVQTPSSKQWSLTSGNPHAGTLASSKQRA